MKRLVLLLVSLALVASACGGDEGTGPFPEDAFAFPASSNVAVGPERLLIAITDESGARLPSPEAPVDVRLYPEGRPDEAITAEAGFLWAIPDVSGLYRVNVTFPEAGIWEAEVLPKEGGRLEPFVFQVLEEPMTVGVGDPAPPSESVTAADVGALAEITTDPNPEPSFYELSIAEAVTSGRKSVIVFATPAFCSTGICAPTMDSMKALAPSYPDVNFLHVEVWTNLQDPQNLQTVQAVIDWRLPTEPWVFVVDENGVVSGRFEGTATPEELAELLT
ncbi:MAG TPA: hypothetical protein VLD62_01385 [Acidimicrobiia bacterium]|nr:hypothetical protein [Acidimicrobiia bacterium]